MVPFQDPLSGNFNGSHARNRELQPEERGDVDTPGGDLLTFSNNSQFVVGPPDIVHRPSPRTRGGGGQRGEEGGVGIGLLITDSQPYAVSKVSLKSYSPASFMLCISFMYIYHVYMYTYVYIIDARARARAHTHTHTHTHTHNGLLCALAGGGTDGRQHG